MSSSSVTLLAVLVALAVVVGSANGSSYFGFGKCNNDQVKVMNGFDVTKYGGTWYEIYRTDSLAEMFSTCAFGTYAYNATAMNVDLEQHAQRAGKWINITGVASAQDASVPAKLNVQFTFNNAPVGMYWILDTDYTNYSVVYACQQVGPFFRLKYGWVLMRSLVPPNTDTLNKITSDLTAVGIDLSSMTVVSQQNCGY